MMCKDHRSSLECLGEGGRANMRCIDNILHTVHLNIYSNTESPHPMSSSFQS